MQVSALLLNWNRRDDTLACLASLQGLTIAPDEVLVVDQGSEDGSVEALETAFPEVRILGLEKNVGVAAGRNLLASMAKGDLLWFLDNDAELPPDALSKLLAGFEAHPEAAVLTMRVDNFYSGELDGPSWVYPANMLAKAGEPFESVVFAGGACGIRREVFWWAGGYDEDYFFSGEEEALALRLMDLGYSLWYWPDSRLLHKVSPNRRISWGKERFYHYLHNRLATYIRHMPGWALPERLAMHLLGHGLQAARNRICGQYLRAVGKLSHELASLYSDRRPVSALTWRRFCKLEKATRGAFLRRLRLELLRKRI